MKALHNTIYLSLKQFALLLFVLFTGYALGAQNFRDNLANDSIGEWPRNWDVVNGSVAVSEIQGQKVIDIANKAIIKPIVGDKTDNYLGDTFTIEFDAFFEKDIYMNRQHYQIRLWNGFNYHVGNTRMVPISIRRNGAKTRIVNPTAMQIEKFSNYKHPKNLYDEEERTHGETWRHIKLTYEKGYVKLFIDEELIFIIPRFPIKPTMFSIGATEYISDSNDRRTVINNIKLHDRIVETTTNTDHDAENTNDTSDEDVEEDNLLTESGSPEKLPCNISDPKILKNFKDGVDYIADCVINVTNYLEIESGVEIQFSHNGGLGVYDNGSIKVSGRIDNPVIMRANEDVEGNYWKGIHIESQSYQNSIENLIVENAGRQYVYCCNPAASIFLKSANLYRLKNITINNGKGVGLYWNSETEVGELEGIKVHSNELYPISVFSNNLTHLNSIDNITTSNINDDYNYIYVNVAKMEVNTKWYAKSLPYLLEGNVLDVQNIELLIMPGTDINFSRDSGIGIYDNASLIINGTNEDPVVLQGKENSLGYWRGIHTETNSAENKITYTKIKNAGSNYVYCCNPISGILIKAGMMTIENSQFTDNKGYGIYVHSNANLLEKNNVFNNNEKGNVYKEE